ncbi:MAG: hypothetical protein HUU25_08830, partial [Candidatus Sumerlaeia bacterium]|nr:hypothetical protein [Candidatus Sumerlaeia bacterium]
DRTVVSVDPSGGVSQTRVYAAQGNAAPKKQARTIQGGEGDALQSVNYHEFVSGSPEVTPHAGVTQLVYTANAGRPGARDINWMAQDLDFIVAALFAPDATTDANAPRFETATFEAIDLRAELSFDAFPQRLFGAVTEIAPLVTKDLRGNRSISLRFALGDDPRLRVGMSVDVDVIVSTRTDVVWVPPSSVLGRGTDRAVYVVDGAVVRKRKVDVGVATWETVEIKGGVGLGELVVIDAAAPGLKDALGAGQRILGPGETARMEIEVKVLPS